MMTFAVRALACALFAASFAARGQDIEPRSYSNAPVGVNFLIGGFVQTKGGVSFGADTGITNPKLRTNSALFAYARAFDLWGMSSKFDAIVPYTWLHGTAEYRGQAVERTCAIQNFLRALDRLQNVVIGIARACGIKIALPRPDKIGRGQLFAIAPPGLWVEVERINCPILRNFPTFGHMGADCAILFVPGQAGIDGELGNPEMARFAWIQTPD